MKRTQFPPRKKPLKRVAIKRKPKGTSSIDRLLGEGLISKASTFKSRPKIRKRAKKRPGEQTQIELFKEIWSERDHVSEISGLPLVEMPDDWTDRDAVRAWVSQFSHLLNKGHYRKYKSVKRNIRLWLAGEHELWGALGPERILDLAKRGAISFPSQWMYACNLYYVLRDEANNVNQTT